MSTLSHLRDLRLSCGGRAAGAWRVEGDHLALIEFDPAPDMPEVVARGFRQATLLIPLTKSELGVVGAVSRRKPTLSIAENLPAELGSGYWLRAFHAACSVAVPVLDGNDAVFAVVSVALSSVPSNIEAIVAQVRASASAILRIGEGS